MIRKLMPVLFVVGLLTGLGLFGVVELAQAAGAWTHCGTPQAERDCPTTTTVSSTTSTSTTVPTTVPPTVPTTVPPTVPMAVPMTTMPPTGSDNGPLSALAIVLIVAGSGMVFVALARKPVK